NLATGQTAWHVAYASNGAGRLGFRTSASDYYRFVASDQGYFIFFTTAASPTPSTLRVLNLQAGDQVWSMPLDVNDRPLLACHGDSLYVIGNSHQWKLSLSTGAVIWQVANSFPNDAGYFHTNYLDQNSWDPDVYGGDPLYRPMVLTDDSLWFVDGVAN